jgi:hypothetical protein
VGVMGVLLVEGLSGIVASVGSGGASTTVSSATPS